MSSLNTIIKMYYIVDLYGNYYRINGNKNLVVAGSREEAGVFSFVEANQRIGSGKKAYFYSTIPIEEYEEENKINVSDVDTKRSIHATLKEEEAYYSDEDYEEFNEYTGETKMTLPYDMKSINWREYLIHFCYIASGIQNYQDELSQALSDVDKQICDIMHYIEMYNVDGDDSIRMIELLKECREQRRDIKDEKFRIECFQKAIGTSSNIAKAKESVEQINKLDARIYHPRKLQELFEDCPEKTIRQSKLMQAFENTNCMDIIEKEFKERIDIEQSREEEGVIMEYTRRKTVFDGKENHWNQFAKQQVEFYANAEQYIYNLQADMNEIDIEIEQIFSDMENSNYNAAQGYKVFKHLKELRNAKKEKQKELECLYILTERFDCNAMTEAMKDCVSEIETVFAEFEQQERETSVGLAG